MEHTASIQQPFSGSIDQPFRAATSQRTLKQVAAGTSTAAWLFLTQFACYFAVAAFGRSVVLTYALTYLGVIVSIAGIYFGVRACRKRFDIRGVNCAAVSISALLFWSAQVFLNHMQQLFN